MEDSLSKIAAFINAKDSRLACAAAVVLTELAPRDPQLTKQLAAALDHADGVRRPFIIEALGRIGTAEAAAALVPLIKSEGPSSDLALRAIAHTGSAALKPLLKLVGTVPPALLERIAECAGRTGKPEAFAALLGHLQGADVDICRAIRNGLRTAMTNCDAAFKEHLRKQLEKSFKEEALTKHHPSLIALMKVAGDLGDISMQKNITDRIRDSYPMNVRRAALQSLTLLHLSGDQRGRLAPLLLPLLLDRDISNIAEPALEAIRQGQLNSDHQAILRKMLTSTAHRIREFAMQQLAVLGSGRTMTDLIACLDNPDRAIREEALSALSRSATASGVLAERLLSLDGGEAALETAKALTPQAAHIPKKLAESLADKYVALAIPESRKNLDLDALRKSDEARRAILTVFRAGTSPALAERVLETARKLRSKDEPQRASDLLKAIQGVAGWNDDHRIEASLAAITYGPKDLARSVRVNDSHLRALEDVIGSGRRSAKDMAKLILKDSSLSKRMLHYLGFHFVERMQNERQFGQMLLENLAAGRTEEGKLAKEKLIIEGLLKDKGGKNGILEERAKVMLAPADLAASAAATTARPRPRPASRASTKPHKKVAAKKPDTKKGKGGSLKSRAAK